MADIHGGFDVYRARPGRLTVAVRGPAGTGKSHFAASMADAGLGRLCLIDTEGKSRLLPGLAADRFDAYEPTHEDTLPLAEWAIGEGARAHGFGCFALDSWGGYFGDRYADLLEAARRAGGPGALPPADAFQIEQARLQGLLRALCVRSRACAVIVDPVGRGDDALREGEVGRLLPLTLGGLEIFVDLVLEVSVRLGGFADLVRVFRVVKSNTAVFPLGTEYLDPTFSTFVGLMREAGCWGEAPPPGGHAARAVPAPPQIGRAHV